MKEFIEVYQDGIPSLISIHHIYWVRPSFPNRDAVICLNALSKEQDSLCTIDLAVDESYDGIIAKIKEAQE